VGLEVPIEGCGELEISNTLAKDKINYRVSQNSYFRVFEFNRNKIEFGFALDPRSGVIANSYIKFETEAP